MFSPETTRATSVYTSIYSNQRLFDQQHRHLGEVNDLIGDRTDDNRANGTIAAGANHDHSAVVLAGGFGNRLGRLADFDMGVVRYAGLHKLACRRFEKFLASRLMLILDLVHASGRVFEKYFVHTYHFRNGQEMDMKRVRSKNFERLFERAHSIVGSVNCNKYRVHSFTRVG